MYKPLGCRVVERALIKLGFIEEKRKGSSHRQFKKIVNGHARKVTLDCHRGEVSAYIIKSIIDQSGVSKKEFYNAINNS